MTYTATVTIEGETYTNTITASIDKIDHDYVGVVTTPATYEGNGVITYTCSMCGDSYTESIAKLEAGLVVESEDLTAAVEKENESDWDDYYYELDVEPADNVTDEDANMISALAEAEISEDETVDYYFMDISFFRYEDSVTPEQLTESPGMIKITVTIPTAFRGGSDYFVIRVHEGEAQILNSLYNADNNTVSFSTDKFSTYALVKVSENVTEPEDNNSNSNYGSTDDNNADSTDMKELTGTVSETETETASNTSVSAQTGDNNFVLAYIIVILACAAAVGTVVIRRRRA